MGRTISTTVAALIVGRLIVGLGFVGLVLAAPAGAVISNPIPIDGPNPEILDLGGVAVAEDGTGGLVYRKRIGGRAHIVASQFVDGAWQQPVRVDEGQSFDSYWPVIGAGEGGRLVVVWAQESGQDSDRLYSASVDPGANQFQGPIPIDFNVGEASDLNPSLAMNRTGQAYLSYRVAPEGGPASASLPPEYALLETRVQRYDGAFWTNLGVPANRNPSNPARVANPGNSPEVAIDITGNGIIAFQEPDDEFVDRIWARRIFGLNYGNPLIVSPQAIAGVRVPGPADAFSLASAGFGQGAVALRQQPGEGGPLRSTRIFVNTLAEAASKNAGAFATPRVADGGGDAGLPVVPGVPDVAVTPRGEFLSTFGAATASLLSTGDEQSLKPVDRLDDGVSGVEGDPVVALAPSGAAAFAWRIRLGGRSGVMLRERRADGTTAARPLSAPRGGPVTDVEMDGTGLGDALLAFVQGGEGALQIVGANANAPPSSFNVQAPIGWQRKRRLPITWDRAPNAIGAVTYTVTVDDEAVADRLGARKAVLRRVDSGNHELVVVATDSEGQQTGTRPAELKVDLRGPQLRAGAKGRKGRIVVHDGGAEGSGVKEETVRIRFGDGTSAKGKAQVSHAYRKRGTYTVVASATDAVGNKATRRKRVRIR